ncbi:YadA-like family protein [Jannaschia sp. CCS1]|uniref:YadA-like family protein n=1 Tax=Jannaschia sp. (strain CCS1) TaxID=290400 RepID=UPI000053BEA5|nr:YadA-like family protein [Jannaschia sp. CCS1]ABD54942.1 hemagluttinin motif precursor [Jannaschia sp. CCS1]
MKKLSITLSLSLSLSAMSGTLVLADQVINDDLIVTQSACVGPNCFDGMDFGFSTLILDGPNPSILFEDSSLSASFPTTDWRVGVDNATNTFAISNADTGQSVFSVNAAGDAIAIGAGATLTAGTVNVGGLRISNVADGVQATDAVTLGQLNAAVSALPTDFAAIQTANAGNIARLNELSEEINAVGAIGSAMSALQLNPRGTGDHFFSIGLGNYEGTTALAIGSFHFLADDRVFVNTGVSAATNGVGGTAARLGVTFGQ